jgi:release factor glutamine methyltransferase
LTLTVTPDVLDPRPDTETIVSAAIGHLKARRTEPLHILDLGVGSGAILCALLSELPMAHGWGVDRSHAAAHTARGNAERLGLSPRTLILQGDWARAMPDHHFDLVVSNPPYIETAVIPTLAREVRDHDPLVALDGGADGLDCYRAIVADLPRLLVQRGIAVLEVGAGQAAAVQELIATAGLENLTVQRDLGGHERAVVAQKRS